MFLWGLFFGIILSSALFFFILNKNSKQYKEAKEKLIEDYNKKVFKIEGERAKALEELQKEKEAVSVLTEDLAKARLSTKTQTEIQDSNDTITSSTTAAILERIKDKAVK